MNNDKWIMGRKRSVLYMDGAAALFISHHTLGIDFANLRQNRPDSPTAQEVHPAGKAL
jgi:hypothetical protein